MLFMKELSRKLTDESDNRIFIIRLCLSVKTLFIGSRCNVNIIHNPLSCKRSYIAAQKIFVQPVKGNLLKKGMMIRFI